MTPEGKLFIESVRAMKQEKELLQFLLTHYKKGFTPIEVSRAIDVSNKTIINRLLNLVKNGFVVPLMAKERIRSYELSWFYKR